MSNYSLIDDNNHKKMSNNSQQTKSFDNKTNSVIETISRKIRANGALSNTLTSQELYLPNMAAYNIAEELKSMETNQLRKIFEQIKNCETIIDDFPKCKSNLYKVLPLTAYAVGRKKCLKQFFDLLNVCINDKALTTKKDIEVLIDFMTSIIAYSKYWRENK